MCIVRVCFVPLKSVTHRISLGIRYIIIVVYIGLIIIDRSIRKREKEREREETLQEFCQIPYQSDSESNIDFG